MTHRLTVKKTQTSINKKPLVLGGLAPRRQPERRSITNKKTEKDRKSIQ